MIHKSGPLRGEKIAFPDGVGCCVWYPLGDNDDIGMCFDFSGDDIDAMIALLQTLRDAPADVFVEEP